MMSISVTVFWALPTCQAMPLTSVAGMRGKKERNFKEPLTVEKRNPESTEGEVATATNSLYVKERIVAGLGKAPASWERSGVKEAEVSIVPL